MSITRDEFEKTIKSKHPQKHLYLKVDTSPIYGMTLDNIGDLQKSLTEKLNSAYHVWISNPGTPNIGVVVKDRDGIFTAAPTKINNNTALLTNTYTYAFNGIPITILNSSDPSRGEVAHTSPKCECGAHKIGSSMHSNWCQIKEGS
jgi:hypothetical protein